MTHEPLIEIDDPNRDRYARTRLIYRQEVLSAAKVMVVGAGALGNEVLKNLALLGVGHVFIVDVDRIEISNLTRSVLFRQSDVHRLKAEVAAERVQALNPDVQAIAWVGDVAFDIGLGVFRQMDVVFGCLDNRAARLAVNRACLRVGRPWIDGALDRADGSVRVFVPGVDGCYECLMTKQDYALAHVRYACPPGTVMEGVALTTPMSASIIGAMQVQEAVKLLHGEPVQGGQGAYYSAESLRLTHVSYPRRADCPAHGTFAPVISVPEAAHTLALGALLDMVAPGDRTVLVLPDKVVTYLYCDTCDVSEVVYRPYRQIVPDGVPCPACGTERVFDVTTALGTRSPARDMPLALLGIPPLDILDVRHGSQHVYVELAGDPVLADWRHK